MWQTVVAAGRLAYAYAERWVALTSAGLFPRRGYHQYELFLRLAIHLSREYTPSSTFDGSTLVVRGPIRPQHTLADLGWSKLVSGPVTTVEVPSDHRNLLRKPAVDLIAAHIVTALEDTATVRPGRTAAGTSG